MSDVPQDGSWWQGVDGKWYPPVARAEFSGVSANAEPALASKGVSGKWKAFGVVAAVVLAGAVAIWLIRDREPETSRVVGKFALIDKRSSVGWSLDENCNTSGGYSDIGSSTQVIVKNREGLELARTDLGVLPEIETVSVTRRCTWTFYLEIPKGEDYYILSVGRRGEMKYSFEEITSGVSLSLGGD
jgi:hypothetical protein